MKGVEIGSVQIKISGNKHSARNRDLEEIIEILPKLVEALMEVGGMIAGVQCSIYSRSIFRNTANSMFSWDCGTVLSQQRQLHEKKRAH
jgi:hypothetical protein